MMPAMADWLRRLVQRLDGRGPTTSVAALERRAAAVFAQEPTLSPLSDAELRGRADGLRARAQAGEVLPRLAEDWFALVRETARRRLGLHAFRVQVVGAFALLEPNVVEMATGEGKTLAAVFAASLAALAGAGLHVWTTNDYLARRDAEWMRPVYESLGLTVGWLGQRSDADARRRAYACDVTYLTAHEAGFDHLREQLRRRPADRVQRPFHRVLVDEADSILIDEARIPLVIAGGAATPAALAHRLARLVERLRPGIHYLVDSERRNVELTEEGITEVEAQLGCGDLHSGEETATLAAVQVALHAGALLRRDVDYLIEDGRIQLVDELKGRIAERRRWPDGIHTALEAKEGLALTREGRILNAITLQSLLALYPAVAGMTGTAATQAEELRSMYGLGVVVVAPNRPCVRMDHPDRVFTHREAKERALVDDIRAAHHASRPILVGTASVLESERVAALLAAAGIPCQVLNARNHEAEAAVIAGAGALGAVTISTNMAGRGVDIVLGGVDGAGAEQVRALGGLYVIGTNRHESRRIDHQLRGRAGRQGDPGESRFFVSLEDDLFVRFGLAEALPAALRGARVDGQLEDPRAGAELERAQRIIEGQHLDLRQHLWRYDRLLEQQRQVLFARREEVMLKPTGLRAERAPERWAKLSERYGVERLQQVERELLLAHSDRLWTEHLEAAAELREGIHLRSVGHQNPLHEFHRAIVELFDAHLDRIDEDALASFLGLDPDQDLALDPELAAPAATWTYHLTDQPFGTALERTMKGLRALVRRALRH